MTSLSSSVSSDDLEVPPHFIIGAKVADNPTFQLKPSYSSSAKVAPQPSTAADAHHQHAFTAPRLQHHISNISSGSSEIHVPDHFRIDDPHALGTAVSSASTSSISRPIQHHTQQPSPKPSSGLQQPAAPPQQQQRPQRHSPSESLCRVNVPPPEKLQSRVIHAASAAVNGSGSVKHPSQTLPQSDSDKSGKPVSVFQSSLFGPSKVRSSRSNSCQSARSPSACSSPPYHAPPKNSSKTSDVSSSSFFASTAQPASAGNAGGGGGSGKAGKADLAASSSFFGTSALSNGKASSGSASPGSRAMAPPRLPSTSPVGCESPRPCPSPRPSPRTAPLPSNSRTAHLSVTSVDAPSEISNSSLCAPLSARQLMRHDSGVSTVSAQAYGLAGGSSGGAGAARSQSCNSGMSDASGQNRATGAADVSLTSGDSTNGRSSFALERIDVASLRPSLDLFGPAPPSAVAPRDAKAAQALVTAIRSLPPEIARLARVFAVIPPHAVVPLTTLASFWRLPLPQAARVLQHLCSVGMTRNTVLANGAIWCILTIQYHMPLAYVFKDDVPALHTLVLSNYECVQGFTDWPCVPDDGYIMLNVMHHATAAARDDVAQSLLLSPAWLETKVSAHGPTAVVQDFYAALRTCTNFIGTAKMLLQAFTLSEAVTAAMPYRGTLRSQLLARTSAVSALREEEGADERFAAWWRQHVAQVQRDLEATFRQVAAVAARGGAQDAEPLPAVHLVPITPSLGQAGGIQRLVLRGHSGAVIAAAVTEDMKNIVSASSDGTMRIWDVEVGACAAEIEAGAPVTGMALAGPGQVLTRFEDDSAATLWSLSTRRAIFKISGHHSDGAVRTMHVHPGGTTALLGMQSGLIRMHSLLDGMCELTLSGGHRGAVTAIDVAWEVCALFDGPVAVSGGSDGVICIWDLMTDDGSIPMARAPAASGTISAVKVFDEGKRVIAASHDGTAVVYDAVHLRVAHRLTGHSGRVNAVAVEPRSEAVAVTVSDDGIALVWDLATGTSTATLTGHTSWIHSAFFLPGDPFPEARSSSDYCSEVATSCALLGGNSFVVTVAGDETIAVWNVCSGERVRVLAGHTGQVLSASVSGRGRFVLSTGVDKTCRVWDMGSRLIEPPVPHRGGVQGVLALGDSDRLLSFGVDGNVARCDLDDLSRTRGAVAAEVDADNVPRFYAAGNEGRYAVTCSGNRHVCVWDTESMRTIHELPAVRGSRVKSAAFSGDCSRVAIVLFDSSITVYALSDGSVYWRPQARGEHSDATHSAGVNQAIFSRDGTTLLTTSKDCTARVWDVANRCGRGALQGHTDSVDCAALSEDSSIFVSGGADGLAIAWHVPTQRALMHMTHKEAVRDVDIAGDQRHILTCCGTHSAWLWNVPQRTCHAVLRARAQSEVVGCNFVSGGALAVTRDTECHVLVWHVVSGQLLAFFGSDSPATTCCGSASGVLTVGTSNGRLHFFQLPLLPTEERYCPSMKGKDAREVVHVRAIGKNRAKWPPRKRSNETSMLTAGGTPSTILEVPDKETHSDAVSFESGEDAGISRTL